MPDFRYRQTTAVLDVAGHPFRAVGRQPVDLGWRAAFPDWQPSEERGEDAQLLPGLRDGEAAALLDPAVEDKETRPPPRYNEGTLIDAMQNAWRFVEDPALRDRLREAKGIGTPATRAEVLRGLKAQAFLAADGKHIVPTERGLALFGTLERADPALVDPGVTAQLECLLDEVLVGRQGMLEAVDAVCAQAQRIIGRLTDGVDGAGPGPRLGAGAAARDRPPTPAMLRYVEDLARRKGAVPPPGYAEDGSLCRVFLDQHAPKAGSVTAPDGAASRPPTPAQLALAKRLAQDRKAAVPDGAKATSTAPSAWIDAQPGTPRSQGRSKPAQPRTKRGSPPKAAGTRTRRTAASSKASLGGVAAPAGATPLRIPFGNKEIAQRLGARYGAEGWCAPPGTDLGPFRERGWL